MRVKVQQEEVTVYLFIVPFRNNSENIFPSFKGSHY